MEQSFSDVWASVGDAKDSCFSFCTEELVGETLFQSLVNDTRLFDVVNLEGMKYP